jgi:hypothetical protein
MKRDKNLHPLSWDHHAALTSVIFTRKLIKDGADRARLEQVAREFEQFHQEALFRTSATRRSGFSPVT